MTRPVQKHIDENIFVPQGTSHSPQGCMLRWSPRRIGTNATGRRRSIAGRRPIWDDLTMQPMPILQTYLDDIADAVMGERFDDYAARILLPLNIQTSSANLTITTLEDLQNGFDDFVEMIQSYGVTRMLRSVKAAAYQGNDHVVGIYDTKLLDGTRQVLPTFHSKMWIGCYDGVWKAIKIHNTTNETRWPILLTRLASESWLSEEF